MSDGNNFGGGAPKERVQHTLNDFRYRIVGQTRMEGATKPPSLGFNLVKDGIALNAYTNLPGDEDNGRISATLSLPDSMMLVIMLERAEKLAPGSHEELAIAQNEFDRASNSRKPKHSATLKIGRNDRGVIYLGVSSWKRTRPVVTIELLPSNLLKLIGRDGQPAPADRVSELMAASWARSLSFVINMVGNDHYKPLEMKNNGGGGQGGGQRGQWGGNGGGGGGQRQGGGNNWGGNSGGGQQGGGGGQGGWGGNNSGGGDNAFGDDLPM